MWVGVGGGNFDNKRKMGNGKREGKREKEERGNFFVIRWFWLRRETMPILFWEKYNILRNRGRKKREFISLSPSFGRSDRKQSKTFFWGKNIIIFPQLQYHASPLKSLSVIVFIHN